MEGGARPTWQYEEAARSRGFRAIGGLDEAGRGPIAGPVVAACVVLPARADLPDVRDSKALSATARERAYAQVLGCAAAIGLGECSPAEVDSVNILRATHEAMRRAVRACPTTPDRLLVDGLPVPLLPAASQAIVRGDAVCISIAAASVVAKVTRDRAMAVLHDLYPAYGFASHKGYPTPAHIRALAEHGPCPAHRRSFEPVRAAAGQGIIAPVRQAVAPITGSLGEHWARIYLERLGHRILATRYRHGHAELDIVSEEGDTVVFVEVKTSARRGQEVPSDRLTAAQQARIAKAAEAFVAERDLVHRPSRYDVIEVIPRRGHAPFVRHYRGAFMPEV